MKTRRGKAGALPRSARVLLTALVLTPVLLGVGFESVVCGAVPTEPASAPAVQNAGASAAPLTVNPGLIALGVAIASGLSCLGAAYAVGRVGAAAIGAATERPEMLTRSLIFVALGEGIAVFGFLAALLLWLKM